jgi:uncharacterized protein (TIGR01777 family)
MKILVSGASGLIGSHLLPALEAGGHQVFRLARHLTGDAQEVFWNPPAQPKLDGFDAIVHLAGESIMGRWTTERKARILQSRKDGTHSVAAAAAATSPRPQCFLAASAIGYYGPHGSELLAEEAPPGTDFLAQVCQQWERATQPAQEAGIRVVNLRIGLVLSPRGGALRQMLPPFRLGVGGRIGSGKQWMSWIAIGDLIRAILFALSTDTLQGPVNLVAPNPVTNSEFASALGRVLHRPALFPLPAAVVKLVFGEMGETLLLSGQRVVPGKLQASGFHFQHAEIGQALASLVSDLRQEMAGISLAVL